MAEEEACINTFVNTVSLHNLYHFSKKKKKKIDIIRDVIIPVAAIFKTFCYHFFCNIKKYDCTEFHVMLEAFSYQNLRRKGGGLCAPLVAYQAKIPRGRLD